jgi:hypothetical protein
MKKLLILICLIFTYLNANSQQTPDPNIQKSNITLNQIDNGWSKWGNACGGCPSFFYKILRNDYKVQREDGNYYYYYYVYFYSNSYYSNGLLASTYLTNVNFYINNNLILNLKYILIPPRQTYYACYIYATISDARISFLAEKINVY